MDTALTRVSSSLGFWSTFFFLFDHSFPAPHFPPPPQLGAAGVTAKEKAVFSLFTFTVYA